MKVKFMQQGLDKLNCTRLGIEMGKFSSPGELLLSYKIATCTSSQRRLNMVCSDFFKNLDFAHQELPFRGLCNPDGCQRKPCAGDQRLDYSLIPAAKINIILRQALFDRAFSMLRDTGIISKVRDVAMKWDWIGTQYKAPKAMIEAARIIKAEGTLPS